MATTGRVLLLLTRHLPRLVLTTSTSFLQVLTRRVAAVVGSVTPSAVWYTSLKKRKTLYFVRSGWVNLDNSALGRFGCLGLGWSRSASSYSSHGPANAYYLDFNPSGVNPSGNINRWSAFPVRCLVILV